MDLQINDFFLWRGYEVFRLFLIIHYPYGAFSNYRSPAKHVLAVYLTPQLKQNSFVAISRYLFHCIIITQFALKVRP